MPRLPPQYAPFIDEGAVAPSTLLGYLPAWAPKPNLDELRGRIQVHRKVTDISDVFGPADGDEGSFRFRCGRDEDALDVDLQLIESPGVLDDESIIHVPKFELSAAEGSDWCIGLTTYLGEQVLSDFHTQLKLLHLVTPEAVLVHDGASFRSHGGSWLRDVAGSSVPPAPDSLYTIHMVTAETPGSGAWMHSHGLHRCGCIELEMTGIPPESATAFSYLFNVTASLFIERGTPPPGEPFEVGQNLSVFWLPWEEGIEFLDAGSVGTGDDRDEDHDMPSGILFAAGDGRAPAITEFREILEGEPVLFLSHMETQRMSLLAKEHFPRFRKLYKEFGNQQGWEFHVKLGYQVDDCPEEDDDNEHLWFDVHEVHGAEVVATLLNQPYYIARMNEGDRDRHAVDQLSDWSIDCPQGLFDASTIGRLEELLG